jgi:hypothetical protein
MNIVPNARSCVARAAFALLAAASAARATPVNSLFNPADYPAVDTNVNLTAGAIQINTQDGTNAPTWTYGSTNYTGQIVTNQSGKVVMALFNFGGLAISNGVSCTVTGNLGLVLSSTSDLTVASTIDVSGKGSATASGPGGAGGEGGVRLVSTNSAPPGATRGNGGFKGVGTGFGGGYCTVYLGTGGGYGGLGGYAGKNGYGSQPGGTNYGSALLFDLFGGSGGGAGSGATDSGGGGGGSLALVANGTLAVVSTAVLSANGGNAGAAASDYSAGGGSGGGILLAANHLNVYGTVQAKGGNAKAAGNAGGGGGGGGRIAFYANALATNAGISVSTAGGAKATGGISTNMQDGLPGTFRYLGDGQGGDLSYPFARDKPSIVCLSVLDVLPRSASLPASLSSTGGDPNTDVICYWGTNSAAWDYSLDMGVFSVPTFLTNYVSGLLPGATYCYAFAASNAAGTVFSATNSFPTPTAWPTISNAGASNITTSAGTVYGYLSNTGESATVVYVLYGTAPGAWTVMNAIGPFSPGTVSNALSGLVPNTTYYYLYAGSNAAGWGYAPTTNQFTTMPTLGKAAQQNSLFNPQRYATLAENLAVSSGAIAIDTGDGTSRGPSMTVNGNTYRGQVVPNQSSNVWLALFNFGSVSIGSAVSCTVTGNLGLVLGSTHDMTVDATLDLSSQGTSGIGGPGAEGGTRIVSTNSAPPGPTRGNGGYNTVTGSDGVGYGAGTVVSNFYGSGGGYGGIGGVGKSAYNTAIAPGGTNYGDSALANLFGGSGGGAGNSGSGTPRGGGGGGALELIANGTLTISATSTQMLNGGAGAPAGYRNSGGGSGGGLILAADHLVISGALQAKGGAGTGTYNYPTDTHNDNNTGGGGGGGRIALYARTLTTNGMSYTVQGGVQGGTPATNSVGAVGTFRYAGDGAGDLSFPYIQQGTAVLFW